ncbi:MAG: hypothetical protein AB7O74_08715 [Candidatus Nanopelagicales bacterium]
MSEAAAAERADEAAPAPPSRPAPFLLLAAVVAALVPLRAATRPLDDIDLYWHILIGQEILGGTPVAEAGRGWSYAPVPDTWVSTQWLAEVLFAWMHDTFGFQSFVVYRTLTTILAIVVLAAVTVVRRPARAGAWPFAIAGLALALTGQDRSQQLTYILAPLVGWWALRLWREGTLPRWWVVLPLVVIWANVHGGWLLLPMALVLAALARALDHGLRDRAAWLAVALSAGTGLAALVSPSGLDNVLSVLRFSSATARISEWLPVTAVDWESLPILLMAVTIVCTWAFGLVRPTRGEVVLVLALLGFGYTAWRSSTPALLMLAPIVTGSLARGLGETDPLPPGVRQPLARVSAAIAAAGCVLSLGLAATQNPVIDPDYPQGLFAQIRDAGQPQRVLNAYNIAGPLLWFAGGPPHVLVGIDGRADRYGGDYIERYDGDLMDTRPGWEDLLAELRPTSALIRETEPLAGALVAQKDWVVVAREGRWVLLHAPGAPGWPASS